MEVKVSVSVPVTIPSPIHICKTYQHSLLMKLIWSRGHALTLTKCLASLNLRTHTVVGGRMWIHVSAIKAQMLTLKPETQTWLRSIWVQVISFNVFVFIGCLITLNPPNLTLLLLHPQISSTILLLTKSSISTISVIPNPYQDAPHLPQPTLHTILQHLPGCHISQPCFRLPPVFFSVFDVREDRQVGPVLDYNSSTPPSPLFFWQAWVFDSRWWSSCSSCILSHSPSFFPLVILEVSLSVFIVFLSECVSVQTGCV